MGIDEIKRWQWIVVGLLVGLGLGWAWTSQDPATDGQLMNQAEFERMLVMKYPKTGDAFIKNIVLEPVTTDYRNKTVQLVRFQWLNGVGQKSGIVSFAPATYIAQIPYAPMMNSPRPAKANLTLAEYLDYVAKNNPTVKFSYGWYNERPAALTLWIVGGVILIGGIWPTLLNLLTGAGMSVPRTKKSKDKTKEEDYFDRFTSGPDPATNNLQTPKVVTDADRDRLEDMNESLERELASTIDDAAPVQQGAQQAEEVRKLQGGPLEVAPVARTPGDDDEVEIKGEFYPVLIHHKKAHQDGDANATHSDPKP